MRVKSMILIVPSLIFLLSSGWTEAAQAQGRQTQHLVSVRVPSVVKIIPDPVAVGPTGLPLFRVVTNDPALRRRMEQGPEGGLVAEALATELRGNVESTPDFRFTVVAP